MLFTNNPEVLPSWSMEAHTSGSLWVRETTQLVLVTEVHFIVGLTSPGVLSLSRGHQQG